MPLLEHDKAIKQYWEEVKDKYPDVDFDRFREACRSPFEYIKKCIQGNKLPKILVKYLGKFRTFPSKIKTQLFREQIFLQKGITDEEWYQERKAFFENHLRDLYADKDKEGFERGETSD